MRSAILLVDELVSDLDYSGKKVLVVQQQVMGTAIREGNFETGAGCTSDGGKLVYDETGAETGGRSAFTG